jgi:hypothetical protein
MSDKAHQLFGYLRTTPQFGINAVYFSQAFAALFD